MCIGITFLEPRLKAGVFLDKKIPTPYGVGILLFFCICFNPVDLHCGRIMIFEG